MLNYSNLFSISVSDSRNEYALTFMQVHPSINSEGKMDGTKSEVVSEIVLNRDGAEALRSLLNSTLQPDNMVE